MSEQRFDIIVQDKVAKSIRTELAGIGTAARSAAGDLAALNAANAAMGARATTAANQAQSAATRTASATARANAEQAKSAIAAARVAEAQARAATAYLKQEAALNRAIAAETRAIASKQKLVAATTAANNVASRTVIRDTTVVPQSGNTFGQQVGSRATAANQTNIMRGTPAAPPPMPPVMSPAAVATVTAGATAVKNLGAASKLSSQEMFQLYANTNDFMVQIASGQSPMTAFIQQGAQMSQIPMQSGRSWREFGAAIAETIGLVKRTGDATLDAAAATASASAKSIAAAAAQAAGNVAAVETEVALASAQQRAAVTANEQSAASSRLAAANQALAAANSEAAITSSALAQAQGRAATANAASAGATVRSLSGLAKGGLLAVAAIVATTVTLGALKSQANDTSGLKKFTTEMGYTAAEVKKLNAVTVGFGDTAKAVMQVGMRRVAAAFGINTDGMRKAWTSALSWMASATRAVMAGIYAAVTGMAYGVKTVIENINDGKSNDNPLKNMVAGYKEAYGDAQRFFDDVVKQAGSNARGRQDQMASEMKAADKADKAKKPKGGGGWDRAKELRQINEELNSQIGLLGKYGAELERAQQLEQLGRQFRENGAPLTASENAALMAKIQLLQDGRRVQEAMTAAEEAANGPARQFETTQEALNRLLASGAINQSAHTAQMRLATRAYEDAIDPLAAMNRELQKSGELMGLWGRDRDVAAYIQQLKDAADAKGESIYQQGSQGTDANGDIVVTARSKKLTPEAQAMVDEFRNQQQQGQYGTAMESMDQQFGGRDDPSNSSYVLDHHRELYAEIERLRQADVVSEEEAARRKTTVDRAYLDARLGAASQILGQLSSLQSSENRKVAAVGKAAAIAQTTIDGIRAVQAAIAGPPGPPWSFAIAGVTAAMTAANVAKIAGMGGFMVGGFTGHGAMNKPAGTVHAGEYVFDAAATNRIGLPALEAARSGRSTLSSQAAGGGRAVVSGGVHVGSIQVRVEGKPDDPQATGREVERGIQRALRDLARDEIRSQQRDGGMLDNDAMAR